VVASFAKRSGSDPLTIASEPGGSRHHRLAGDPTADNTVTERAFFVMIEGKTVGHDRRGPR
jgi:hypothetical protein